MEAWLSEPPIPTSVVEAAGGPLAWWDIESKTRPRLARMGLAYLTAPGKLIIGCNSLV